MQRASAVYLLCYIVFVLVHILLDPPTSYRAWREWASHPGVGIASAVFFAALLAHMWVGLRDVIIDYVHPIAVRATVLALLALGLTGIGAWVLRILWLSIG